MDQAREIGGSVNLTSLPSQLPALRLALLDWASVFGRSFPWREADNPFHVLIAEMMLRRTQARQVVPVYLAFIGHYPDAASLASAPSHEVSRALYSLGLAWRVPAFQLLAQTLVDEHDGKIPADYESLISLPGVGDYVASAVLCFAFSQPVIIADTNTVRVAGRVFGIETHAESRRRKPIRTLLEDMLDREHPRSFNLALLDHAALVCLPSRPRCESCPIASFCSSAGKFAHD